MNSQPLTATAIAFAGPPPGESGGGLLEAEKKVNLDLEIGRCAFASEGELKKIVQVKRERLFSGEQFDELCNQICIYNSIAYGFPVAFHLLLPIWMSVFKSLGPAIYNTYPTLFSVRGFGPEKSDHSSVMDSEPGRCRRTDGRKWRCSKNVVPLQKYCERHMHRGRQGSRKHVEPIQRVRIPNNHRASDETRMPIMSLVASDVDDRVSVSVQSDLGPSQPRSAYRSGFPAVYGSRDAILANNSISGNYTPSTCSSSRANCLINGGDHGDGKSSLDDADPINLSHRKQNVVGNNYVGFNSPKYGLSPKSVLNAAGKIGLGSRTMEAGAQRCRRTDGKKWQCRRDALHNQKYCEAHMHRGAKRLMVKPEYSRCSQVTPTWTAQASCAIIRNLDSGINLNTVPASPRHGTSNDSSSSTSDATTITDENISYCLSNNSLHHG